MKSLYLIVLFIATFGFCYLLLSLFGLLFHHAYSEVLGTPEWFAFYTLFVGWGLGWVVVDEEYKRLFPKN